MSIRIQEYIPTKEARDSIAEELGKNHVSRGIIGTFSKTVFFEDTCAYSLSKDAPNPIVYLFMFDETCSNIITYVGYWRSRINYSPTSAHNKFFTETYTNGNGGISSWFSYQHGWRLAKAFYSIWIQAVQWREDTYGKQM